MVKNSPSDSLLLENVLMMKLLLFVSPYQFKFLNNMVIKVVVLLELSQFSTFRSDYCQMFWMLFALTTSKSILLAAQIIKKRKEVTNKSIHTRKHEQYVWLKF